MTSPGTRRSDLRRTRQRKKPKPLWLQRWGRTALWGMVGVVVLSVGVWSLRSGWIGQSARRVEAAWLTHTATVGLAVTDIFVTGRGETGAPEVLDALGVRKGQPLLSVDPPTARAELETLPWVRSARVERRFPGTVFIHLIEREPVGIFQRNRRQSLVDETGAVLTDSHLERWADLPVLVGEGAPQAAPALIRALAAYPDIYWRVRAMSYIYERRWDLLIDGSVTVRLPEEGVDTALGRLDRAQKERQILDGAVKTVDLRLPDRMTVEPVPAASSALSSGSGSGKAGGRRGTPDGF